MVLDYDYPLRELVQGFFHLYFRLPGTVRFQSTLQVRLKLIAHSTREQ